MNKELLEELNNILRTTNVRFGTLSINLSYHDGRVTTYESSITEKHNVLTKKEAKNGKN